MFMHKGLILASSSRRRKELLYSIGVIPDLIVSPDVDETPLKMELPRLYAGRIALEKARVVASQYPDYIVVAADTVTACGRRILPKAENKEIALQCLKLLSGRRHRTYTSVCVMAPNDRCYVRNAVTIVKFKHLSTEEIREYIASCEWHGTAGGCSIQGRASMFVQFIRGTQPCVSGLPLYETAQLLRAVGYKFEVRTVE